MAYPSMFDDKYGSMEKDFSPQVASSAPAAGGGASAAGAAGGAAAISGNPYALAGSFLINYMNEKRKAFEEQKQREMALAQNYEKSQNQGLQSLGSTWGKALGR